MTTKRKKKSTMDAIDKYLLQKRYSEGKKFEKKEKTTKKVMQVVVPKVSSELYSPGKRSDARKRRSARSLKKVSEHTNTNLSKQLGKLTREKNDKCKQSVNRLKKQLQVDIPKLPKSVVQKTSKTAKLFASNQNKNANKRNLKANRSKLCDDIENVTDVDIKLSNNKNASKGRIRRNAKNSEKIVRTANTLSSKKSNCENRAKKSTSQKIQTAKKFKKVVLNDDNSVDNLANSVICSEEDENVSLVPKNTCDNAAEHQVTDTLSSINEATIITDNGVEKDSQKNTLEHANNCLPKKKRKIIIIEETENARTNPSDLTHEPCCSYNDTSANLQGGNVTEITEEITPITKKYQPYIERLKLLTSVDIQKHIKDKQQHYVDYKKQVESKTVNIPITAKKKKCNEMRESFKCNPFSSDQQLAMYYTLREIFDVPKTHFVECRNLFTVLLPEISCQLFAETFRIEVSAAPRLIKKLYPHPICPV